LGPQPILDLAFPTRAAARIGAGRWAWHLRHNPTGTFAVPRNDPLSARDGPRHFSFRVRAAMSLNRNDLQAAIDQLEHALAARTAGREMAWRAAVDQSLAGLEQTVRQHAKTLLPADGKIIDVDRPRIPSPGVSRRAE